MSGLSRSRLTPSLLVLVHLNNSVMKVASVEGPELNESATQRHLIYSLLLDLIQRRLLVYKCGSEVFSQLESHSSFHVASLVVFVVFDTLFPALNLRL